MLTQVLSTEGYCNAGGRVSPRPRRGVGPQTRHMRDVRGPRPQLAKPWLLPLAAVALATAALALSASAASASAAAPQPLSAGPSRPAIGSTAGSGIFGRWFVDG